MRTSEDLSRILSTDMDNTSIKIHKNRNIFINKHKNTLHNSTNFTTAIDPGSISPMGHFFCVTFPKATVTTSPGKPRGIKNSLVTTHRCSVYQRNFTRPPPSSKAWLGERAVEVSYSLGKAIRLSTFHMRNLKVWQMYILCFKHITSYNIYKYSR